MTTDLAEPSYHAKQPKTPGSIMAPLKHFVYIFSKDSSVFSCYGPGYGHECPVLFKLKKLMRRIIVSC